MGTKWDRQRWENDAARIGRAFGIQGEFRELPEHPKRFCKIVPDGEKPEWFFNVKNDLWLGIIYMKDCRLLQIAENERHRVLIRVHLGWRRTNFHANIIRNIEGCQEAQLILAKGLYYLDFLTPELEASLGITVSAHEKLEWRLEYEARYGL